MKTGEQLRGYRFKKGNPGGGNTGNKGPYLTNILKKILSAKWKVNDPTIQAMIHALGLKEDIAVSLVMRRILNACEGDDLAIERIFDRIDGKVPVPVQAVKQDENLIEAEFEIVPNGDKPGAIERFKGFLS